MAPLNTTLACLSMHVSSTRNISFYKIKKKKEEEEAALDDKSYRIDCLNEVFEPLIDLLEARPQRVLFRKIGIKEKKT